MDITENYIKQILDSNLLGTEVYSSDAGYLIFSIINTKCNPNKYRFTLCKFSTFRQVGISYKGYIVCWVLFKTTRKIVNGKAIYKFSEFKVDMCNTTLEKKIEYIDSIIAEKTNLLLESSKIFKDLITTNNIKDSYDFEQFLLKAAKNSDAIWEALFKVSPMTTEN